MIEHVVFRTVNKNKFTVDLLRIMIDIQKRG